MIKQYTKLLAVILAVFSVSLMSDSWASTVLEKGDAVRMTVYQEDDLTTNAEIGKTGEVSFPLLGNVKLNGLTLKEAEKTLKDLYEKDYLQNANVNLSITSYAKKWVIVGGEVRSPGTIFYPQTGTLDLRAAIAQAGGERETADITSITVTSKSGKTRRYSLRKSGGVALKHGDAITVSRSRLDESSITVTGKVGKPGVVPFPKAGSLDILTAIAQAGGFSHIANSKEVTVRRGKQLYKVNIRNIERGKDKMFYMKRGDILHVNESTW